MKLAWILTSILVLRASASDLDFWPKQFEGRLDKRAVGSMTVDPCKITALYVSASWCTPCKEFTPQLVSFRDQYTSQFQFVVLRRDRPEQSRKKESPELAAPVIAPGNTPDHEPFWNELRGSGVSQLLVFGPGGELITRDGRSLLENKQDPSKPRNWGNRKATGYREWERLLVDWHHLGAVPEVTSQDYFAQLKFKHGTSAFWPVYLALIRTPGTEKPGETTNALSTEEIQRLMEEAAADVAADRNWGEIWRAAELLSEGNLEDGGPHHRADRLATRFFHAVGALAAGDALFAESCNRAPKGYPVVHSAMLCALSAAAATGTHYLDEALFWLESRDYLDSKKSYRLLEPLLLAGNPRAYAVMAEAARKKALYHFVKAPLESAAEAGRQEPLALLGQMELQDIQ